MGRSQRHKVMEQGISASQETWAEGVGEIWPDTTYNERGLPQDAGPQSPQTGGEAEPLEGDELPLTMGAPGGPLQGSAVQSATSEGGSAPKPPEPEPGPEPPEPEPDPIPTLTGISPTSLEIDTGPQLVTVTGTDFLDTDTVNIDGTPVTTVFVSPTELTAEIPTDGRTDGEIGAVTVWYGEGMTDGVDLTFTAPEEPIP